MKSHTTNHRAADGEDCGSMGGNVLGARSCTPLAQPKQPDSPSLAKKRDQHTGKFGWGVLLDEVAGLWYEPQLCPWDACRHGWAIPHDLGPASSPLMVSVCKRALAKAEGKGCPWASPRSSDRWVLVFGPSRTRTQVDSCREERGARTGPPLSSPRRRLGRSAARDRHARREASHAAPADHARVRPAGSRRPAALGSVCREVYARRGDIVVLTSTGHPLARAP